MAACTMMFLPHLQLQGGNVAEVQKMAMRGLRLKVGISTGPVMDYISPATARIMYRGRVMNWAARISHLATGGQVGPLTSDDVQPCGLNTG
jgi:class 3 adenylate cyclase